LIKDRVKEIKQDVDWKENIAKEWNDAAGDDETRSQKPRRQDDDARSEISYKSAMTGKSGVSLRSQVEKAVRAE